MNNFSDFKIKANILIGDKIKIQDVLNFPIEVHSFKITNSKFPKDGYEKCLHIQLKKDKKDYVLFTSSNVIIDQIKKVPKEGFPFKARIIKAGKSLTLTN